MHPISIFCIATSRNCADQIVKQLMEADFPDGEISLLFADDDPDDDAGHGFTDEGKPKAPVRSDANSGNHGSLFTVGGRALAGMGPFIGEGPIVTALSGAAMSATAGGMAGGLIGTGMTENTAKLYEGRIKQGNILISVQSENNVKISHAKAIFTEASAEDISITHGTVAQAMRHESRTVPGHKPEETWASQGRTPRHAATQPNAPSVSGAR